MRTKEVPVHTGTQRVVDVTETVRTFCAKVGRGGGLVNVVVPHATAGLAIIEVGAGSDQDLAAHLDAILPRDDRWRHAHGSPGHGADHVLPAFIAPTLTLPVDEGRIYLGTWQSIVLVDTNVDNHVRTLRLSFLGG